MQVLLMDLSDNSVSAIITTTKTTEEQIQDIIDEVKTTYEGSYDYRDIERTLPDDCKIQWLDDITTVWW